MSIIQISPNLVRFTNNTWILDHPFAKNGGAMLTVTADWCGHCTKLKQILPQAQQLNSFNVFNIDGGGDSKETKDKLEQLGVKGFPTIFYLDKGGKLYKYEGDRSPQALADTFHR